MPISTRDLSGLPNTRTLEKITQSLAVLDAIMSPEWEYRYFSFNPKWDQPSGERMASMSNGSGDEYFLLFTVGGAILKGFDHECPMSTWPRTPNAVWPGVLDHVPEEFAAFLSEPAFNLKDTTFCIWKRSSDSVAAIEQVFKHQSLTPELVAKLDTEKDFAEALRDAEEIGYGLNPGS